MEEPDRVAVVIADQQPPWSATVRMLAVREFVLSEAGLVARCRACGEILAVLVTIHGITCVDLRGVTEA